MELPDTSGTMRSVLKIDVPRSLFVHESPGGYFQRQGSSRRKMPPEALARLFQQRSQARLIRFDEQAVPETTPDDLDRDLRRRFLTPLLEDNVVNLEKLKLLTKDATGQTRATVAGVLLCSEMPEKWLPAAFLQAVHYRGTRPDANYQLDAHDFKGPLDKQIHGALGFVQGNMRISARKNPMREEFPEFSQRAVFEALVNAVAHRDYSIYGSKVRLFMFDDRLELYSPGSLPNSMTTDSIALRQSTRNELITTLLAKCPVLDPAATSGRRFLMEKRGEGVPIIMQESRELSGREPEYRLIDDAELLLTIYSAPVPDHGGQR
jgi:predicted HTH transcriptional regulator